MDFGLPLLTTGEVWHFSSLFTAENLLALGTLTALEIVLGIDNIVFIAILTSRLPQALQSKARKVGLAGALLTRVLLLLSITWIMGLDQTTLIELPAWIGGRAAVVETAPAADALPPAATALPSPAAGASAPGVPAETAVAHDGHRPPAPPLTGKDLVLLIGGIFLIYKSTKEIHEKFHHEHETEMKQKKVSSFSSAIVQIMILDIVFSLDSVITAVGTAKSVLVMILAVILAVGVMMMFANAVSRFVEHNPTVKMLALSFLLMIGVMLVVESVGQHINKGYIYFAMGFSLAVEMLNIYTTRKPAIHPPEGPSGGTPTAETTAG